MLNEAHANVLRLINQSGPLSRTELVSLLGVSKATMSALAAELIDKGMLTEAEVVYGSGRPSVRLALAPASAFFVGVSLVSDSFLLRVTDLHGVVIERAEIESSDDPTVIAEAIAAVTTKLSSRPGMDSTRIAGIGLAVPGLVDAAGGICVRSTLLGWREVPIGPLVAAATGLSAFVENDANALVLGEHLFGELRGAAACTLVSIGDGIGCGHIINGELHRGHRGGAGEIAHSTIELNGQPCKCGKRGCLDTLASMNAIANAAREVGLPGGIAELDLLASRGEQEAIAILHRSGAALGLAISQIAQALDPQSIVVALGEGSVDGLYPRVMQQTFEANVMPGGAGPAALSIMTLDEEAWAVGAASVAAGRALFRISN